MIIFTNCLAERSDEGCLNVANNLIRRIKAAKPETRIISHDRKSPLADEHIETNKAFFHPFRFGIFREKNTELLYIPFPARPIATAVRIFNLSMHVKGLKVLSVMTSECGFLSKLLLKLSGAKIIVLSGDSYRYYLKILGEKRVEYIKTGVDIQKFSPATSEQKAEWKAKYGISADRRIILHVGHMQQGRNIAEMMKFDERYQIVIVTSTFTNNEHDSELHGQLANRKNIFIIDQYQPNIEQIYQMSDLYFFPVVSLGHCIDIPLSCLEAAACNIPVLATEYGELKELLGQNGFFKIQSFEKDALNKQVNEILSGNSNARKTVEIYDWGNAIAKFFQEAKQ